MKRPPILIPAFVALFLLSFVLTPLAEAQDKTQAPDAIVYVNGLACPFCAYGLEKKLKNLDVIQKLKMQLEKDRVLLTFKEGHTLTKKEIQQAVKKAGFTARKIEFADRSPSASASS